MSLGFIKFNGFLDPPTPPLSNGIPSITYNGWLFKDKEPVPRMLMVCPSPGAPEPAITFTPATLPLISDCADTIGPLLKSLLVSKSVVPVKSSFLTEP